MLRKIAIVAVSTLVLGLSAAQAQDWTLSPTYGSVKLVSGGFQPDPYTVDLQAGGAQDASTLGGNCVGFIADAPDFRVLYTPGGLPLIFSIASDSDTTLVVNDPNGNWICDDDSAGNFNPMVQIDDPPAGQYDIWVGTYSQGGFPDATLSIAEQAAPPPPGALDWHLDPNYGTFDLTTGFAPDPFTLDLVAGGNVSAEGTGDGCTGFVTTAPDMRLNYSAGDGPLFISVASAADTTLIVNDPNGNWICDDDSGGGYNPAISLDAPASGQYDIWVGTYDQGPTADATLYLSETEPFGGGVLNWDLDPAFGAIDLSAGFAPDPQVVDVTAGGDVDASPIATGCAGFVTSAPTYRIQYDAGDGPLTFYVMSEADTTLVIADPDGNWFCNDDTNDLNPQITFDPANSGQYDIWVGTYDAGPGQAATLFITGQGGPGGNGDQTGGIDWSLTPTFGEVDLAQGFAPDPLGIDLTAGGDINAATAAPSCVGNVAAAPDYRIHYQPGDGPLYFWVEADADTTLVINDPNGDWICDDDNGGNLNPAIGFDHPLAGQYDVWVGTYNGGTAAATLHISDTVDPRLGEPPPPSLPPPSIPPPQSGPPPLSGPPLPDGPVFVTPQPPPPVSGPPPASSAASGPAADETMAPTAGAVALEAGFSDDPTTVAAAAGGMIDAASIGGAACVGFVTAAPTVTLTYTAGAWPLILSAEFERGYDLDGPHAGRGMAVRRRFRRQRQSVRVDGGPCIGSI